jgi:GT2 family glycosyltransferase
MLSICIPVFNKSIKNLYNSLSLQSQKIAEEIEILVIDDCSEDYFKLQNKKICNERNYIELTKNVGRSKIRNIFLKHARFENLLFLDCDSKITDDLYLTKYINELNSKKIEVIFGGSVYHKEAPDKKHLLRWDYGSRKENIPFEKRKALGNKSFLSNNFLVKKKVFEKVRFDETISKYGYEDTIFCYELKKNGYTITQLDNSVLNNEFETNTQYLKKVTDSIENLYLIMTANRYQDTSLCNDITLIKTYKRIEDYKTVWLFHIFFMFAKPLIKILLTHGYYGSLILFNLYKLGLLSDRIKKN